MKCEILKYMEEHKDNIRNELGFEPASVQLQNNLHPNSQLYSIHVVISACVLIDKSLKGLEIWQKSY